MNRLPALYICFFLVVGSMYCLVAAAGDAKDTVYDELNGFTRGLSPSGNSAREILSYINSGGLRTRIEQVMPDARTQAKIAEARFIGTENGWRIYSEIQAEQLIIWQTRSPSSRHQATRSVQAIKPQIVLRSSFRAPNTGSNISLIPGWWPALRNPWVQRSANADSTLVTILGWVPGTVADARRLMVDAAKSQSLSLDRGTPTGGAAPLPMGAELLFFSGPGQQLMMTLTPQDAQVGVVAYYRYHRRMPNESSR